jgi:hypothetical protein
MKSLYDFIVTPLGSRYNNTKKVEDKTLVINTNVENHIHVNKKARVVSIPAAYNTKIKEGDIVYVHHNLFRRWYDQRGKERNTGTYFKDDLYFCSPQQIYMYNNKSHLDYCFVKPIIDIDALEAQKERKHYGILKYSNDALEALNVPLEALVTFTPESEFEFIIEGERLYCMKFNDIALHHEYEGNEKEYNPSWTHSSGGTDKSSEGGDCRYGRGCVCGPSQERSCH